jgi:hypothetical protein
MRSTPVRLDGPATRTVQTNQDGRFVFRSLTPGQYTVAVPPAGGNDFQFSPSRSSILQNGQRYTLTSPDAEVPVPPRAEVVFSYVHVTSGLQP